jgi:predicted nucleic acid-binding protein
MFLVDTNVISELRKGPRADLGAVRLLRTTEQEIFLPVQVIGELRQGVESLKHRGDFPQAELLANWLVDVETVFARRTLVFDTPCAHLWGKLMGPSDQNPIDKQIAAIALHYDLTVVTRNTSHFAGTGVRLLNPFAADAVSGPPVV